MEVKVSTGGKHETNLYSPVVLTAAHPLIQLSQVSY